MVDVDIIDIIVFFFISVIVLTSVTCALLLNFSLTCGRHLITKYKYTWLKSYQDAPIMYTTHKMTGYN